jgi:hypothetical protein
MGLLGNVEPGRGTVFPGLGTVDPGLGTVDPGLIVPADAPFGAVMEAARGVLAPVPPGLGVPPR